MSSLCTLLAAVRISPSEEINSVYIKSAPYCLQTYLNGGSLTSSMGASSSGNSPSCILPIFTIFIYRLMLNFAKLQNLTLRYVKRSQFKSILRDSNGLVYFYADHQYHGI